MSALSRFLPSRATNQLRQLFESEYHFGQNMKAFAATFLFVCFAAIALAQSDEKPIQVLGVVSLEVFPGRPNFENIKDGDEPEKAWILAVSSKEKKDRFQLVVVDHDEQKFMTLRKSVGKKVVVEGLVWEAHTGHHHTPFLITVRSIREVQSSGTNNSEASPLHDGLMTLGKR